MKESFWKIRRRLIWVIFLAIVSRIIFFFNYHPVWWDSASYIGMGKYLLSNGQVGIFEFTRPLAWPFILGSFWKLGLDSIIMGRITILLLSVGSIILTFLIAEKVFNKNTALISSLILCFTPTYFFYTYRLYNHIPAVFFSLFAVFLYLKIRSHYGIFLTGLVLALAFQTRFPQGAYLLAFLIFFAGVFIIYNRRNAVIDVFFLSSGFLIGLIPLITFNLIVFRDALYSVKAGASIMKYTGWVFFQPWYYYFITIIKENIFYIFSLLGVYYILKDRTPKKRNEVLILLLALIPFIYYQLMTHKEMRFLIISFPFLAILAAHGFSMLGKFNKKHLLTGLFIVLIALSAYNSFKFYNASEPNQETLLSKEFYRALAGQDITGQVLISMPQQALDINIRPKMMYYPRYTKERIEELINYVRQKKNQIQYILLDTGEGGTMCYPEDTACEQANEEFIDILKENYNLDYHKRTDVSEYFIFTP